MGLDNNAIEWATAASTDELTPAQKRKREIEERREKLNEKRRKTTQERIAKSSIITLDTSSMMPLATATGDNDISRTATQDSAELLASAFLANLEKQMKGS